MERASGHHQWQQRWLGVNQKCGKKKVGAGAETGRDPLAEEMESGGQSLTFTN